MKNLLKKFEEWFDTKFGDLFTNPNHMWRWEERQILRQHKH